MNKNVKSLFASIREAQKLMQLNEYTRAFNLLSDVEKKTNHLHLKSKIANLKLQCLYQVGNINAAIDYVESLLTLYPLSGQITFLAASVYRKLGDQVRASRLYLRCVCLYPDNTQYALIYAQFLKEANRMTESIGIIRKALKKNPRRHPNSDAGHYFLYLELALNFYYIGYYGRALVIFNYCAEKNKTFPFFDLISDIYLKKNNAQKAYDSIRKHIKIWGNGDPDALFILAKTLVSLERKDEALKYLRKCQKLWGELVITTGDMTHLFPLLQDGSLKKIPNLVLEL